MNQVFQLPHLGYTREFSYKVFQSLEAWFNLQQASIDYQFVLLEVWLKTIEEFLQLLIENQEPIQQWQDLLQVWSEVFDRTFAQTFQTEQALRTRGRFLQATITLRQQQQQLMEVFLKWNNLPTRSEIDEIHHSIYELRKELKAIKRTSNQT